MPGLALWQALALGMSFAWTAYLLVNQHYRLSARLLCLWRGAVPVAVFGPFLLLGHAPQNPTFYLLVVIAGLIIGFFDRHLFSVVATHGSGAISRLLVLGTPLTFVAWVVLIPGHLAALAQKPHIALLPFALLGMMLSVAWMRRDHVSRNALLATLPLIAGTAVVDILLKLMFTLEHGLPAYMAYGAVSGLCVIAVNLLWPDAQDPRPLKTGLFAPRTLRAGLLTGFILVMAQLLKPPAMEGVPNPSFITAMGLLSPVWVMVWNKVGAVQDASNWWAGMGCVLSALLLLIATA